MSDDNKDEPYNPLGQDTLSKMLAQKAEREKTLLKKKEKTADYLAAINRLFSSPDGKYFLNEMKNTCGVNLFDNEINPAKLIEDAGRRKVWFELIRPYLDVQILRELDQ